MLANFFGMEIFLHVSVVPNDTRLIVRIIDEGFYNEPSVATVEYLDNVIDLIEHYTEATLSVEQRFEIVQYLQRLHDHGILDVASRTSGKINKQAA